MNLRKLNSVISLITIVLIMDHAIFYSVWMLSRCSIAKSAEAAPRVLMAFVLLHAVLSIVIMIRNRKGKERKKQRLYVTLNMPTMIQRVSGILMLVLISLHIAGAVNHFQPKMLHAVLHPVFFAAVLAHTAVSVSKAFITLGIGNAKVIKAIDVIMAVVCTGTFIAGIIGFYLCLFVGVAR